MELVKYWIGNSVKKKLWCCFGKFGSKKRFWKKKMFKGFGKFWKKVEKILGEPKYK